MTSIRPFRHGQLIVEVGYRVIGPDTVALLIVVALVHKSQVMVKVKRDDVLVEICRLIARQVELSVVQPIRERLKEAHGRGRARQLGARAAKGVFPVRRLQVLDGIDPAHLQEWEEDLERGDDVLIAVAAVVDDDVEAAVFLVHPPEQRRVVLAALVDPDALLLERCLVVKVEADNLCLWEVVFPHTQGLSSLRWVVVASHTDLEDGDVVTVAEGAEVVIVVAAVLVAGDLGSVGANGSMAVLVCAMLDCKFYQGRFLSHCCYDLWVVWMIRLWCARNSAFQSC